jgi:hypothetical protein
MPMTGIALVGADRAYAAHFSVRYGTNSSFRYGRHYHIQLLNIMRVRYRTIVPSLLNAWYLPRIEKNKKEVNCHSERSLYSAQSRNLIRLYPTLASRCHAPRLLSFTSTANPPLTLLQGLVSIPFCLKISQTCSDPLISPPWKQALANVVPFA